MLRLIYSETFELEYIFIAYSYYNFLLFIHLLYFYYSYDLLVISRCFRNDDYIFFMSCN